MRWNACVACYLFAPYVLAVGIFAAPVFTTISKGDVSEQETPRQVVVRTPAEWQAVWSAHAPSARLPAVDFATKMVVGIFLGTKATGGYDVAVVNVREDGNALVIEYVVHSPGRDLMTAQILTQPYHLIALPKHPDPIRFAVVADQGSLK